MRVVGPNCLGIIAPHAALNASFANGMPAPGRVAFLSQSGALCTSVLDWALQEKVGFSYFVSVGNMLDVGIGDLIDYLATDPWTEAIILYVESITEAREFMSAARTFARQKPIIAYKAGRFTESAMAAASHTGAMAGVDTVYEAAFSRAGIVRVLEMADMFDCAELLARQKTPSGPRLAIVTNAGGPGVMATDALLERKGTLAKLADETIDSLNQHLPPAWSHNNPIDILGDASAQRLAKAVEIVLADQNVDAVLVIFSPQAMSKPTDAAKAVIEVAKPYVARNVDDAVQLAHRVGYPVALKVLSPQITHKTDVGGVELSLANEDEVSAAFKRIVTTAKERRPDAQVEGVTVQKMVSRPGGQELIVGARRDSVFGAVLLVGAGGTAAELFQDRALELPPLNERLARRMLESLRSWPLLQGYRGRAAANIDRLIEVLMRLSYLVADYPEIKELDVNPLLVSAADADHTDAEYAVLVADAYQGQGLGSLLTDYCLEISKGWGIGTILAEIAPDNRRMLAIFQHRGFEMDRSASPDVVLGRKVLG